MRPADGSKVLTVFISVLELQDLRHSFSVGDQVELKLAHRPGLRAEGSIWGLPAVAVKMSGPVGKLASRGDSASLVFRPLDTFVYFSGVLEESLDYYTTDEVLDTSYALGPAPDELPSFIGIVRRVDEVRRAFVERDGVWQPTLQAPRLTEVAGASWEKLSRKPVGDAVDKLDGFVVALSHA